MTDQELLNLFNAGHKACTDSRETKIGNVFFALKGENFNGNLFAKEAIENGATLAIVDQEIFEHDDRIIKVEDVIDTLQMASKSYRKQFSLPVIGITGTNGKTTTKELLQAVLNSTFKTLSTTGNLNNHIGVPLTLLELQKHHQIAVVEMGANHVGEIGLLSSLADPNFGLITNIGKAHLEGFGSVENIVKTKTELYRHVKENNGTLFVNGDNPILTEKARGANQVLYGTKPSNHLLGVIIEKDPFLDFRFKVMKDFGEARAGSEGMVCSRLVGNYNLENLLAALTIGLYFGVETSNAIEALEGYTPANHRSQLVETGQNTVILDAYNANPTSMTLALENLESFSGKKKAAILGDMLELGPTSSDEHEKMLDKLKSYNFDTNIVVGPQFCEAAQGSKGFLSFFNVDEAIEWLRANKIDNHLVLVKGSRGIKMEKVMECL